MAERRIGDKVMRLVQGDVTKMQVDAFVHDITSDLKLGSGFGSAIQQRGGVVIQKELDQVGHLPVGESVVTQAGVLKAEYIIHANGPKFREEQEEDKLRRTVRSALSRAEEKGIKVLAMPPIGTGLYQVPVDLCARVMVDEVASHLQNSGSVREVLFVVRDTREYSPFAAKIQEGV
jgi:O-acetyl-ADP-ribose deacetylase (regulator of RNase III)